jgi:hypothetical protein
MEDDDAFLHGDVIQAEDIGIGQQCVSHAFPYCFLQPRGSASPKVRKNPRQPVFYSDATNNAADLSHGRHEINWQWGRRQRGYINVDGRSQDGYPRHNEGFEMVLADGHAKWRSRKMFRGLYSGGTEDQEWLAARP